MVTWLSPDCPVLTAVVLHPNLKSCFCFYSCNYIDSRLPSPVVHHQVDMMFFLHLSVWKVTDLHDKASPTTFHNQLQIKSDSHKQYCASEQNNFLHTRVQFLFFLFCFVEEFAYNLVQNKKVNLSFSAA